MAKISALVIPATIDTSGIDKGINQIKSKMSRVTGQTMPGTSGGGAGHSAGITPMGGANPWGGGSAVGSGLGAAFGAAAGARSASGATAFQRNVQRGLRSGYSQRASTNAAYMFSNPLSRAMGLLAGRYSDQSDNWAKLGNSSAALGPGLGGLNPMAWSLKQQAGVWQQRSIKFGKAWMHPGVQKYKYAGVGSLSQMGLGMGGKLGLAAAGAAAWEFLDPKNQESRWSDSWSYRGTNNYSTMVNMRRNAMDPANKQPGFFQSMDIGGAKARGRGHGNTTNARNIGNALSGALAWTGEAIGASLEGPFAKLGHMAGGGDAKKTAQYTEKYEFIAGSLINMFMDPLESTWKKIFN